MHDSGQGTAAVVVLNCALMQLLDPYWDGGADDVAARASISPTDHRVSVSSFRIFQRDQNPRYSEKNDTQCDNRTARSPHVGSLGYSREAHESCSQCDRDLGEFETNVFIVSLQRSYFLCVSPVAAVLHQQPLSLLPALAVRPLQSLTRLLARRPPAGRRCRPGCGRRRRCPRASPAARISLRRPRAGDRRPARANRRVSIRSP